MAGVRQDWYAGKYRQRRWEKSIWGMKVRGPAAACVPAVRSHADGLKLPPGPLSSVIHVYFTRRGTKSLLLSPTQFRKIFARWPH